MGTNFYIKTKLSQAQKDEINKYISEDNYEAAIEILELSRNIHIGKRSAGWKFLWDVHNFRYFEPTKEAMFYYLQDKEIIDEDNVSYTFSQFLDQINIDKGYDLASYDAENPFKYHYTAEIPRNFPRGIFTISKSGEFYLDDCRCTAPEDFS